MTYQEAKDLISKSRHRDRAAVMFGVVGPYKRYYWLILPTFPGDAIMVRLHNTIIARIHADDSVTIHGGHAHINTASTKLALDDVLGHYAGGAMRGSVSADKKVPYFYPRQHGWDKGTRVSLLDGDLRISKEGKVLSDVN